MPIQVQEHVMCASCRMFPLCLHTELKKQGIVSGSATESQIKQVAERKACSTYNEINIDPNIKKDKAIRAGIQVSHYDPFSISLEKAILWFTCDNGKKFFSCIDQIHENSREFAELLIKSGNEILAVLDANKLKGMEVHTEWFEECAEIPPTKGLWK